MTKQEAIEILTKSTKWFKPYTSISGAWEEAMNMAIEALSSEVDCSTCKHKDKGWDSEECDSCCGNNNHYESDEDVQGEWIPCSERLPEDLQKAITCNKHGKMMIGTYTEWGWMFPCYFEKPIAWMPLPKPYREDGEA